MHVLIAMSNRFNRRLVGNLVRGLGLGHVEEADNDEAAHKYLTTATADLIIVGLNLQTQGGIAFTQQLRTDLQNPSHRAALIMIADSAKQETVIEARDSGINEFLVAPLSNRSMKSHLLAAINRQRTFVEEMNYVGPDRRRTKGKPYQGPNRRKRNGAAAAAARPAEEPDSPPVVDVRQAG